MKYVRKKKKEVKTIRRRGGGRGGVTAEAERTRESEREIEEAACERPTRSRLEVIHLLNVHLR